MCLVSLCFADKMKGTRFSLESVIKMIFHNTLSKFIYRNKFSDVVLIYDAVIMCWEPSLALLICQSINYKVIYCSACFYCVLLNDIKPSGLRESGYFRSQLC